MKKQIIMKETWENVLIIQQKRLALKFIKIIVFVKFGIKPDTTLTWII